MKDVLSWKEPRELRPRIEAMQASKSRWWHAPVGIVGCAAVLLAPRFLAPAPPASPTDHWLPLQFAVPLSLCGGAFLTFGLPWLESLFPVYLRVKSDRIVHSHGQTHQVWLLKDVESYSWETAGACSILTLRLSRGRKAVFGVVEGDAGAVLEEILSSRGIRSGDG